MTARSRDLPDYCTMRTTLRAIGRRHPVEGQRCPTPRCAGRLTTGATGLACETCGWADDAA